MSERESAPWAMKMASDIIEFENRARLRGYTVVDIARVLEASAVGALVRAAEDAAECADNCEKCRRYLRSALEAREAGHDSK